MFNVPLVSQAHQSGCHRWHSCPSDSGSYTCGDLGYTSGCPTYTAPSVSTYAPTYTLPSIPTPPTIKNSNIITQVTPTLSGTVAYSEYSCDYFIVKDLSGNYALLEWYGGRWPYTDDKVYDKFNKYGFTNVYTGINKARSRVWVEDYLLSQQSVIELYLEKCE